MFRWIFAIIWFFLHPILRLFNSKHEVPGVHPGRPKPNPKFFPRYMQNRQGLWLHWAVWSPDDGRAPEGVIFFVGGLAEHAARYDSIAARFTAKGFMCFTLEHQGQGGSEGERRYFESFDHVVDDYIQFVRERMAANPSFMRLPRFLLGHSMGGLITAHILLRGPNDWSGAIFSAPALTVKPEVASPMLQSACKFISGIMPKLPVDKLALKVSRNEQVCQLYDSDPLVFHKAMCARWAAELMAAMDRFFADLPRVSFPFLALHGSGDDIVSVTSSEKLMQLSPSTDKRFALYRNAKHELFTDEECCEEVYCDVFQFVDSHMTVASVE